MLDGFLRGGSLNSDQFATLIADCEKIKADLDKLDLNVAQLYAAKCRKPVAELLALSEADRESAFGKLLSAITSLFKPIPVVPNSVKLAMNKTYTFQSAILADKPLTVTNGSASISEAQLEPGEQVEGSAEMVLALRMVTGVVGGTVNLFPCSAHRKNSLTSILLSSRNQAFH